MRVGIRKSPLKPVHSTADASWTSVEDMGVNHRCLNIFVPQKFLDISDFVPGFEEMGSEGMPKSVVSGAFNPMAIGLLGSVVVMAGAESLRSWSKSLGLASRPVTACWRPALL
jgi:hypothetical protein